MKSKLVLLTILFVLSLSLANAQNKTVNGTVTNKNGEPLPGVTVLVKSTTIGTSTDIDGQYSLSVPEQSVLVFSFIGYTPVEIAIENQSTINATLNEDVFSLDEVVAIGYGTQRKSDLTGSVTSIGTESFNEGMISSPEQLI
ncbi:MAG: carboxypeptidase-like regulatory domain-containing protein, partial [Prolixibacteraceae bacterium]|nr:carboxypeptidase-like regulatory domain-containing protein [Prolixibacteraceae bacterium]